MRKSRVPVALKLSLVALILVSSSLFFISADGYPSIRLQVQTPQVPEKFQLLLSSLGAELYQKQYAGGNPDFVQVIDLSKGAKLVLLHGDVQELRPEKGVFGGNDARFNSKTLGQYWYQLALHYKNPFCVTNGQFFYMLEYPTRLPFPLKVDGQILTDGYDDKNFTGQELILELWDDQADIRPLTRSSLYTSTAPDILAGLAGDARKSPDKYVARTFIGVMNREADGKYRTVLIFNTQTARQADAAQVLRDFGAAKVMMLDGGGSTQLICRKTDYISSDRLIPQAIGVVAGSPYRDVRVDRLTQIAASTRAKKTAEAKRTAQAAATESAALAATGSSKTKTASPRLVASATAATMSDVVSRTQTMAAAGASQSGVHVRDVIWIPIVIILIAPLVFYIIQEKRKTKTG
jgi:hypothetical protein